MMKMMMRTAATKRVAVTMANSAAGKSHASAVVGARWLSSFPSAWRDAGVLKSAQTASEKSPGVFEVQNNAVRSFVLNRPKALNALNQDMIRFLTPKLAALDENDAARLITISGYGDKAFCAGGDIVALYRNGKQDGGDTSTFFLEEYTLNHQISQLRTPYVALLNGITMGGGVGLSVHGRYRVAMDTTLFAMPETGIGFFPDVGGSHFLPRLNGQLGMFLALTGHRLKGADIFHAGVATHYVESKLLLQLRETFESMFATGETSTDLALDLVCTDPADLPEFSLAPYLDVIDDCFGQDSIEKVFERLESTASKQDGSAEAEWAAKQLKTLGRMSPTALKVTFRQIREGETKSLEECLKMEFRLSQGFMRTADFFEGVRALLVDKDNQPKWQYADVTQVPDNHVDEFFDKPDNADDLLLGYLNPDFVAAPKPKVVEEWRSYDL
eukprot:TRINITY_DN53802_c0_g1_i1.p1 TRINITY_DN53802_c0_g1~~TRINITY_DN53802_c0_g1_i1.p1  ORF type:complete len:451 (-),score=209.84 TRINITY_DN53802_c0_g1_i1:81-1409(-)